MVDVGKADLLHGIEVIQVSPVLLKTMCCRQRVGVVAQMVLAKLARRVAQIVRNSARSGVPGSKKVGLPGNCGGITRVRNGYIRVINALRPDVQLCMAQY